MNKPEPRHAARTTQSIYPARAVLRTLFQMIVGLAAIAPAVYVAATGGDLAAAGGWVGAALAIAGGLTRVMALPAVEAFLEAYLPWLAASPAGESVDN